VIRWKSFVDILSRGGAVALEEGVWLRSMDDDKEDAMVYWIDDFVDVVVVVAVVVLFEIWNR
jgi:hypothetical protein